MNCSLIKQQAPSIKLSLDFPIRPVLLISEFLFFYLLAYSYLDGKEARACSWTIIFMKYISKSLTQFFSPLTVQNHKNIPVGAGFNISQSFLSTESRKYVKICASLLSLLSNYFASLIINFT